jgi:hypothetical protein
LHITLEDLDLLEHLLALGTTVSDEGISTCDPRILSDSGKNGLIKAAQMLSKEWQFLFLDSVLDVVVVANNKHDVLFENAQLLLTGEKFAYRRRNCGQTTNIHDLHPVGAFSDELVQF